ncbi:hypothetical protein D3C73_1370380 [compost metagenome]
MILEEIGCGYVTEPGDYSGIEQMSQRILEEQETIKSMGTGLREYLFNNLSKDVSVKKYKKEILEC